MIELLGVQPTDRAALDGLLDSYLGELAMHRERPVGATDARTYHPLRLYWSEAARHPFFIVTGGRRVGFVLVREIEASGVMQMAEFYVLPELRRSGVGRAALGEVWRRFPGPWELQVHLRNRAGIAFWSRCIGEFAAGPVRAREVLEEDGRRLQFDFEIPAADARGAGQDGSPRRNGPR